MKKKAHVQRELLLSLQVIIESGLPSCMDVKHNVDRGRQRLRHASHALEHVRKIVLACATSFQFSLESMEIVCIGLRLLEHTDAINRAFYPYFWDGSQCHDIDEVAYAYIRGCHLNFSKIQQWTHEWTRSFFRKTWHLNFCECASTFMTRSSSSSCQSPLQRAMTFVQVFDDFMLNNLCRYRYNSTCLNHWCEAFGVVISAPRLDSVRTATHTLDLLVSEYIDKPKLASALFGNSSREHVCTLLQLCFGILRVDNCWHEAIRDAWQCARHLLTVLDHCSTDDGDRLQWYHGKMALCLGSAFPIVITAATVADPLYPWSSCLSFYSALWEQECDLWISCPPFTHETPKSQIAASFRKTGLSGFIMNGQYEEDEYAHYINQDHFNRVDPVLQWLTWPARVPMAKLRRIALGRHRSAFMDYVKIVKTLLEMSKARSMHVHHVGQRHQFEKYVYDPMAYTTFALGCVNEITDHALWDYPDMETIISTRPPSRNFDVAKLASMVDFLKHLCTVPWFIQMLSHDGVLKNKADCKKAKAAVANMLSECSELLPPDTISAAIALFGRIQEEKRWCARTVWCSAVFRARKRKPAVI